MIDSSVAWFRRRAPRTIENDNSGNDDNNDDNDDIGFEIDDGDARRDLSDDITDNDQNNNTTITTTLRRRKLAQMESIDSVKLKEVSDFAARVFERATVAPACLGYSIFLLLLLLFF